MNALKNIRVLDLSHALAGPFCGMLLADLGAEVIKVEHPHGDHFRPLLDGAYFAAVNRNKRGISLDLKRPEALEAVKKLAARSDILLESFTPGTLEKLGLGYETVKALNPGIIYCSISGFGQTGPYRSLPGYDVVAQAMCGIMMSTGTSDGPPVRVGASLIDMGAGMFSVIGIQQALMERQTGGEGRHIDIDLLDTALSWMSPFIAQYSMTGKLPKRMGSALAAFSPYQVFRTKDGFCFIGASTDRFWARLCKILDMEHLVEDPRFLTNADRVARRDELTKIIEDKLADVSRDEIAEQLREADVPCSPILDVGQVTEDPHVKARGVLHEMDHSAFGPLTLVKTPITVSGRMPEIREPAPALGEHTRAVLSELGYGPEEIEGLIQSGAAVETKKT